MVGAALVAATMLLSACETRDIPTRVYASGATDQALVVRYENKWNIIFEKVDLEDGILVEMVGKRSIGVPKHFTYNGRRVTPDVQKTLGISPGGQTDTGYRIDIWEPGDYALTGMFRPTQTAAGAFGVSWTGTDMICFTQHAPVFRLEPGVVNVLEAQNLLQARVNGGATYDPQLVKSEEDRIRFYLADYPELKGEVRLAPVVATVEFYGYGNRDSSLCSRGRFNVGEPRPMIQPG